MKNNKYNFLFHEKSVVQNELDQPTFVQYEDLEQIKFIFAASHEYDEPNDDIIHDGLTRAHYYSGGPIVKSEIRDSVHRQLKDVFDEIKKKNFELECLKMSKKTQEKFRIHYAYEVSYVPKGSSTSIGKVIGSIMGARIVEDNSLEIDFVTPVVKSIVGSKSKFQKIFQN